MQAHATASKVTHLRLSLVMILAGCLVVFVTPVAAFEYEDVPRLELDADMAQSTFKKQTQLIRATPSKNPALAFRIRLPDDWQKVGGDSGFEGDGSQKLSSSLLSTVAHYRGLGSFQLGRSFFKLKVRKLKEMITARKWIMHFNLNKGYSIEAIREISPKRVAVRYTTFNNNNNTSYTVLAVAAINGDHLALAEYYVPTQRMKNKIRDRQTLSIRSFALLNKHDRPIEPIKSYDFVDIASFDYPESWLVKGSRVYSLDKMNATLYRTKKDKLQQWRNYVARSNFEGRIRIKLIARKKVKSIQAELEAIRENFQKRGLNTGKFIREIEDIDYDSAFDLARTQVYNVSDQDGKYLDFQLWVAVMRGPRYYVLATLFTPERGDDYYNWAVNGDAFKFIISSLDIYYLQP